MSYARHLPVLMYHHVSDKPGQITLSPPYVPGADEMAG